MALSVEFEFEGQGYRYGFNRVVAGSSGLLQLESQWGATEDGRERGFLRALDGGCQVPVAALAAVEADGGRGRVALRGRVVSLEGDVTCEGTLDIKVASGG